MRGSMMTEKEDTVCFVTCVNDEEQYQLCVKHLQFLSFPPGVHCETYFNRGASGLASGYNQAIRESRAKYKIYLHQDTYIMNTNFISDLLALFKSHPQLGLVGLIGARAIPDHGVWWYSDQLMGKVIENRHVYQYVKFNEAEAPFQSVAAVDGLLLATQYDIPWREDIFDGWHYYDLSQCFEFRRRGYSVGIPHQAEPWVLHNCGLMNTDDDPVYHHYRMKFLHEYGSDPGMLKP
ncbi:glycosyltransferase family protein [Paenibacillus enshidis]|uniref:Glycosyltransferase family protein n=2 Tax=Paenibacillus enshidis TaxID=1458439 RepID=A0ABV5AWL2_9BACL